MSLTPDHLPWFALQVKPRFEKNAAFLLTEKGFDVFLPLSSCRRQWRHKVVTLELPLFPGYLFCRFNPNNRLLVLTTMGVSGVVTVSRVPACIPDVEIENVRRVVEHGRSLKAMPYVSGQTIRVLDGPLRGVEGVVVSAKKKNRIVVSINLLQRSVSAEIELWQTAPATSSVAVSGGRR